MEVTHRVSSVGNPHSNNGGELSVKSLKRLLREYVSGAGFLDNDAVTQALLAHANTPCKVLGLSPAQIASDSSNGFRRSSRVTRQRDFYGR